MDWQVTRIDQRQGVVMLTCPSLCWDSFPAQAEHLLQQWELTAIQRALGADRHSWQLEFEGTRLRLEYEHYSGCWLAAEDPADPVDHTLVIWLGRYHGGIVAEAHQGAPQRL